jgi:hypothetical protein
MNWEAFEQLPYLRLGLGMLASHMNADPVAILACIMPLAITMLGPWPELRSDPDAASTFRESVAAMHIGIVSPSGSGKSRLLSVFGELVHKVYSTDSREHLGIATTPAIMKALKANGGVAMILQDEMFQVLHNLYGGGIGADEDLATKLSLLAGAAVKKTYVNAADNVALLRTNLCGVHLTQPSTLQHQMALGREVQVSVFMRMRSTST